jgi:hypothetical protein
MAHSVPAPTVLASLISIMGRLMAEETDDLELEAIKTVLRVLTPLDPDARSNVIDYVFRRLGITAPTAAPLPQPNASQVPSAAALAMTTVPPSPTGMPTDLRSLTEQKQPKSANQMVAVLAYYLANLAPPDQRRDHILPDDIKRFFPQANFPLPTGRHNMTLVNAKNAGYLDVLGGGQYRLNPVGHNLVTHKLPRADGSAPNRGTRRVTAAAKKKKKS